MSLAFGWQIAVTTSVVIEGTQIEGYWRENGSLKGFWFKDTILDMAFSSVGIIVGSRKEPLIKIFPRIKKNDYKITFVIPIR